MKPNNFVWTDVLISYRFWNVCREHFVKGHCCSVSTDLKSGKTEEEKRFLPRRIKHRYFRRVEGVGRTSHESRPTLIHTVGPWKTRKPCKVAQTALTACRRRSVRFFAGRDGTRHSAAARIGVDRVKCTWRSIVVVDVALPIACPAPLSARKVVGPSRASCRRRVTLWRAYRPATS